MTNPEVRRQKQLTRQRQKLKEKARRTNTDKASALQRQLALAATAPIRKCLVPDNLNEQGIGMLVFGRTLPGGRIAAAMFLVDVFCLGVKNASLAVLSSDAYAQTVESMSHHGHYAGMDPASFRKLVEGAVSYADNLGFPPHPDYAVARRIFGDVDAASSTQTFAYGRNGKPFYVNGPDETPSRVREIIERLQRQPGGADYMVGGPPI